MLFDQSTASCIQQNVFQPNPDNLLISNSTFKENFDIWFERIIIGE